MVGFNGIADIIWVEDSQKQIVFKLPVGVPFTDIKHKSSKIARPPTQSAERAKDKPSYNGHTILIFNYQQSEVSKAASACERTSQAEK